MSPSGRNLAGSTPERWDLEDQHHSPRIRGVRPIRDQIARWREDVANPKRRVPLGWAQLDQLVRGPAPGEVFTLLAASHVGKSLFATNVMANNPDQPIIMFSLEMPEHQVLANLVAHVFDYNATDLEDEEHRQTLPDLVDELPNRLPTQAIVDDDGLTFEDMTAYLEDFSGWYGERPALAIIDYLEEIGGAKASGEGYLRTEAAAAAAKAWAKRQRIGVLLLHQTKHNTKQWEPPAKADVKSAGYAQPLDEPVLTPDGWTVMGELQPGDNVVGPDGQPTKVLATYPLGRQEVYRVWFRDGGSTRATAEHLWQVQSGNGRHHGHPPQVVRTWELNAGKGGHSVPVVDPIPGTLQDLPLDPYVLGVMLGDGSFPRNRHTLPFWDFTGEVAKAVRKSHYRTTKLKARGAYSIPGIGDAIRELWLEGHKAATKFVPPQYLRATIKQRLALLRGLMDTDGHSGKNPSFATISPYLRDAVVELVQSLGGLARVSQRKDGSWSVYLYGLDLNPFRIPSKAGVWAPSTNAYPRRVVAIEAEGVEEVQCIRVGRPDGLYVTKDYIVTHNTEADVMIGAWRPGWDPALSSRLDISERSDRESFLSLNVIKNRVRGIRHEELTFRIDPAKRIVETWTPPTNHYANTSRFFAHDD